MGSNDGTIIYSCSYMIIWFPKYVRPVLVDGVDLRLREIILEEAGKMDCEITELQICPDMVKIRADISPHVSVHKVVKHLKSTSSSLLRKEFPWLKKRLPALWSFAYLVGSYGNEDFITLSLPQFIEKQKYSRKAVSGGN